MNLSIKGLYLGLGALLSVLLLSALLAFGNTRQLRIDAVRVNRSHAVVEALQTTLATLVDAETGQRGYLLTGDQRYLEPYRAAVAHVSQNLQRLGELVWDEPGQRARIQALKSLSAAKLAELDQTIAEEGVDPAAARRMVQTHLGRSIMVSIRLETAAMTSEEQDLLAGRERASRRDYLVAVLSGGVFALAGLALAAAFLVQLRRHFAQREQFEQELRQNEQRFRTLTELAPDAIWINRDDRIELVNSEALRLLGADRADQVEGLAPYDIFHPDCHKQVRTRLRTVRNGGTVQLSEETVVRLDGTVRQVEVASAMFEDAKGPAIQVVLRDITRRRRRDQEVEQLNRALRALSKSSQALVRAEALDETSYLAEICGIIIQDCGHAMVWIGFRADDPARSIRVAAWAGIEDGYLDTLAFTWADEPLGRGPTGTAIRTGRPEICRDTWTDPAFEPWREEAMKRGYRSSLALPLLDSGRAFGAITLYARRADAFSPGEVTLLEELGSDLAYGITSRRLRIEHALAEETLRESEERFRAAFEQGAIPMSLTTFDGRILRINAAYCQMFGYTEAELQARSFMAFTHPDDLDRTRAGVASLAGGEQPSFRMEKRYLHKDGRVIWGDMCCALVPDAMGRPLYMVTHIQDITERKRAEQDLREANRRKDEFLATLAHELRNPLAPIRTGAFLLAQRATADPETRQIHEMIARQAAHMARLVDDLLDISRIEQGRLELRREAVDLGRVAAHAVEACRPLIEAGRHQLVLSVPVGLPKVEADPVRLEQMLCNLLNNACKYTPAGGTIQVAAVREGAEAVLRVRDSGIGLAPEALARVFDLFYQAGQPSERAGGLGIGLTLVRRLAELHGGSVLAASDGPGQGSEFMLRLPALPPAPPAPAPAESSRGNGDGRQRHVLIIDDDLNVRMTSEMLLKAMNYQVTVAATGEKGIEKAKALRPEIAIIDLGMPGLDGLEVAARIRAELGSAIFLVALTGYSRESDFANTRAAGFDRHLVKSGDPRELLHLLEEISAEA